MQFHAPEPEYVPAEHSLQVWRPSSSAYLPPSHGGHDDCLLNKELVPRGHNEHALAPASENVPGPHSLHTELPFCAYHPLTHVTLHEVKPYPDATLPPGQSSQLYAEPLTENVPGEHSVQFDAPSTENVPEGHGVHELVLPSENVPAGHGVHIPNGPPLVPGGHEFEQFVAPSELIRPSSH